MAFPILARAAGLTQRQLLNSTPQEIIDRTGMIKVTRHLIRAATPDAGRSVIIVLATLTQDSQHTYQQEVRLVGRNRYWVSCECANFRYVWEYALAQKGASDIIHGNGAAPVETNPGLVTGVCKHICAILMNQKVTDRLDEEWSKSARLARRMR